MSIKTIIVDDEEGARESLANILCKFFPGVEVIARADSAKAGIREILAHRPDLVFLDIEMPNGNAFDMLVSRELEGKIGFDVIFVTAFDHYAIQAIKFSALDYLLKPIDIDDLRDSLKRYKTKTGEKNFINQKLEVLLGNIMPEKKEGNRKIAVPDMDGLTFIQIEDIIRFESDGNYTTIFSVGGNKLLSSKPLSDYDEMFASEPFFRVHRSHLININHIRKYFRGEGGYVLMSDNSQIEVSRRKKNEFLEKVGR